MRFIKRKKIVDENIKIDFFSALINSAFFIGYIPVASGTFGSAFALMFFLIPGFSNIVLLSFITLVCFILSLLSGKIIIKKYGEDPSVIVIDEVIGMWITVITVKLFFESVELNFLFFIVTFISFRIFDVFKIFPSTYFDNMKNIFGVLMDDVVSGVYAGFFSILIFLIINYLI